MAVEVYWWPPKGTNVGHAAMKVDGGAASGVVYLSAWPGSMASIVFGPAAFNTYAADVAAEGGSPHVVRLTKLNESAIKMAIKADQGFSHYSFVLGNCATQVALCLNAGLPLYAPHPFINAPWGLYVYARSLALVYA